MECRHRSVRCGRSGIAAFAIVTACAGAHRSYTVTAPMPQPVAGTPRAETALIDETFQRQLDDGCSYRGRVHGTMATAGSSSSRFDPNLRVEAWLYCPSGVNSPGERRVHGAALSAGQIENAIERAGEVLTYSPRLQTAGSCAYSPDFEIVGSRIEARGVTRRCDPAPIGGGPRR